MKINLRNLDKDNKTILYNVFAAFIIKGGSLIISLLTMPAFIKYFNDKEVLGVWFTLLSVLIWILSFDLGIGNGFRNNLVKYLIENDRKKIKDLVSSAYFSISIFVIITTFIGFFSANFINWNRLFNISENVVNSLVLIKVIKITFIGIMLQFIFKLSSSIIYAFQKASINNLIGLITSSLQLLFILLTPSISPQKNLILLSYGYAFFTNLPFFVASIIIFSTVLRDCKPNIKNVKKDKVKIVLNTGGLFFWCQIMYMLIMNTNELFITRFNGPDYVVDYQVYYKLFSLIAMLFMLALSPIWSSVTKAMEEKKVEWLKKLFRIMNISVLLALFFEFFLIFILQPIVNIWLKEDAIEINIYFSLIFAFFGSVFIYQSVLSTIVCGLGKMKFQAVYYTIAVILKVLLIYILMKKFNNFIVIVAVNAIILLPYCILEQIRINSFVSKNLISLGGCDV